MRFLFVRIILGCTLIFAGLYMGCMPQKQPIDLLIIHAKIYTVDDDFSIADAMCIRNGKVVETGNQKTLLEKYTASEIKDAGGQYIFPGFIDAHAHFTGYALDAWKTDLTDISSFDALIEKLISVNDPNDTGWIYGRGWDQHLWKNKALPDKQQLDAVFPHKPVFLKRIDGHAALVNQKALDIAGIHSGSKINNGEFLLKDNKPTGMLIDSAMHYMETFIPPFPEAHTETFLLNMQQQCFKYGITGVNDCGISTEAFNLLEKVFRNIPNHIKLSVFINATDADLKKWIAKTTDKSLPLSVCGFKIYADGALGSRGACLKEPYNDRSGWFGFLLADSAKIHSVAAQIIQTDYQLCTHAIGDSANETVLKLYAQFLKGKNNKRWRIEHAQVINPACLNYFRNYHIIPSVQPTHAISDMEWAGERIGLQRMQYAYAYKDLLQTNGWLPLGTDFPVEDMNPLMTFYSAVVRKNKYGKPGDGFQINNALSREEALRGITIWAAKSTQQERYKGSLEPGKDADFVLLNTNIMQCDEKDLLSTVVTETYVNGKNVYTIQSN